MLSRCAEFRASRVLIVLYAVFAGVCFVGIVFLLPETYVPYLLYKEAKRLRKETGDDRWHSQLETNAGRETVKDVLKRTVLKPFIIIYEEPMLLVITLYSKYRDRADLGLNLIRMVLQFQCHSSTASSTSCLRLSPSSLSNNTVSTLASLDWSSWRCSVEVSLPS